MGNVSFVTGRHEAELSYRLYGRQEEAMQNIMRLQAQYDALRRIYDYCVCMNNEWGSVGMAPPTENVIKLKAVTRKAARIARQLKIEWDE